MTIAIRHHIIPALKGHKTQMKKFITNMMAAQNAGDDKLAEKYERVISNYMTKHHLNSPELWDTIGAFGAAPETMTKIDRMTRINPKHQKA